MIYILYENKESAKQKYMDSCTDDWNQGLADWNKFYNKVDSENLNKYIDGIVKFYIRYTHNAHEYKEESLERILTDVKVFAERVDKINSKDKFNNLNLPLAYLTYENFKNLETYDDHIDFFDTVKILKTHKSETEKSKGIIADAKYLGKVNDAPVYEIFSNEQATELGSVNWCISQVQSQNWASYYPRNRIFIHSGKGENKTAILIDRKTNVISSIWDFKNQHIKTYYNNTDVIKLIEDKSEMFGLVSQNLGLRLIEQVSYGDVKRVKMLIDSGANLEMKEDLNGDAPLLIAIRHSYWEIVRMLLNAGANPNNMGFQGLLPIFAMLDKNYIFKDFKLLIDKGADVTLTDYTDSTPLIRHCRIKEGKDNEIEVMQLLIDSGVDVNAKDESGNAAIHYCILYKAAEKLEFLLTVDNININIVGSSANTPMDLAIDYNKDVIDILQKAGAKTYRDALKDE